MRTGAYVMLAALLVWGIPAPGMTASVKQGKALFEATDIGSNSKSCATCHPGGKSVGDLSGMDQDEVVAVINACIVKALGGKPLPENSEDMLSLVLYLQSLSSGGEAP